MGIQFRGSASTIHGGRTCQIAFPVKNNLAYPFWAFVFPHGSLELAAIFFAGGAGLLIAKAILLPGRYRVHPSFYFSIIE